MLEQTLVDTIYSFLKGNNIAPQEVVKTEKVSYAERKQTCKNQIGNRLYEIMTTKKTNLAVAADFKKFVDITL